MKPEPLEKIDGFERSSAHPSSSNRWIAAVKNNAFQIASVGFGVAALAMILGSTLAPTGQIKGENMVLTEVEILPYFYMKPITFFTFSLFLSFGFGLYSDRIRRLFMYMRPSVIRVVYIVAWLLAMGSGFEVVYNAVLWSAALALQGLSNPDIITNIFPISVSQGPINIVFASKIVLMIFFMSIFLLDYVHRIDRSRRENELLQGMATSRRALT